MAFDVQIGRTIVFGGGNTSDTWGWNGVDWEQLATNGPSSRGQHAMAYDSQRSRVVLFGGTDGVALSDTWEWDGVSWLASAPAAAPPPRFGHAMAFDSVRGRSVIFGGSDGPQLGDTWEWDGVAWTLVAASGPPARRNHAMAFDAQRGRTVVFGGWDSGYLGDTWEWDGGGWTQPAASGPGPRDNHAMAYDSNRGRCVMFGGNAGSGDTWQWDGVAWAQLASAGPASRFGHAMAFDSIRDRMVLFGGSFGPTFADTWEWDGGLASVANPFAQGCGNPALTLAAVPGFTPRIGGTAQVALTNVPSSIAFVALGWSKSSAGPIPLPLNLAIYGMPGCFLLQSAELAAAPTTPTGPSSASYSFMIPPWSNLIGLPLYVQGWANAPGYNPGQTIVSNGVEWVIGNT